MKKKIILTLVITMVPVLLITSCSSKADKEAALAFKEEYESINGEVNSKGKEHRSVTIPEDNPFEKVEASKIVEMIENEETFYVYFGDKLCPWCRSVIEKACDVAKDNKIKKIYYVNIWDDDGNEISRDKYQLVDGEVSQLIEGSDDYYKLLEYFDELLNDYTLTDDEGNKVEVGEKRIFAPNFVYVKKGKPVKLVEGISDKQTDSREELTDEMLKDEEEQFNELFSK